MRQFSMLAVLAVCLAACVSVHDRTYTGGDESLSQRLERLRTDGPRKRILLLPFVNDSIEKDPSVARTARDALVSGLRLTDNFIILDNHDVQKDLKQFYKNGAYDMDEISKIASEMGVLAIVEGRVLEIKVHKEGDEVGLIRTLKAHVTATVGVRVVSAANGREIMNETRTASSESRTHRLAGEQVDLAADPELIRESLTSAFEGMVFPIVKAVDKITWAGRIALVSGDRIYLNAGRLTGLNIGDILRVSEDGEDVYDPNTGALIGKAPGRMKGTLEVVSYFGKDGCVTVVHSGSGFKENDKVELY